MSPTRRDPNPLGRVEATTTDTDRDTRRDAGQSMGQNVSQHAHHDGNHASNHENNHVSDHPIDTHNSCQEDRQRDLSGAKHYALTRLEQHLPERFVYHSLEHTRDNVYPIAMHIAELEGVSGQALCLLKTAIYFHDLGFSEPPHTAQDHELRGAAIALQVLPNFGYDDSDISLIQGMILATKLPQQPKTLLERIMADADLSVLGQRDFLKQNRALRAELESGGLDTDDQRWFTGQYNFLSGHRYFTRAARQLLSAQKAVNLASLRTLIAELP